VGEGVVPFGDASRSALWLRMVRFGNDGVVGDLSAAVGKIKELVLVYSTTR